MTSLKQNRADNSNRNYRVSSELDLEIIFCVAVFLLTTQAKEFIPLRMWVLILGGGYLPIGSKRLLN